MDHYHCQTEERNVHKWPFDSYTAAANVMMPMTHAMQQWEADDRFNPIIDKRAW